MNYEVFIDASFWVALIYKRDQNYGDAREHWERVNRSGRRIVTTNWTLYEALTILNGRHARHDLALELLDLVHRTNTFVADASAFEQDTLTIFTTHTDKRWSVWTAPISRASASVPPCLRYHMTKETLGRRKPNSALPLYTLDTPEQ